jgi:hypothetical protein
MVLIVVFIPKTLVSIDFLLGFSLAVTSALKFTLCESDQ